MLHVVTGGAGFIGVNLVRRLLGRGERVIALDNFLLGRGAHLRPMLAHPDLQLIVVDCADLDALRTS
jgi:nucleoside-diphosphate-sugar epimerase